jgi:plastocyanin
VRSRHFVTALIVFAAAACGGDKTPTDTGQTGGTGPTGSSGGGGGGGGGSTSSSITVADFNFSPAQTTVPAGTTIVWSFSGPSPHNVTFDNSSISSSGDQTNGGSFSKQFNAAGTYTYQCTNHYGMSGSITVQ